MTPILAFVARNSDWFTVLSLAGVLIMLLGWMLAWWDWRHKRGTLQEDMARVTMWRYGVSVVFFLFLAGGVQLTTRVAPDGHIALDRLFNPAAQPVLPTPTATPLPVPVFIPTPTPTVTPTPTPKPTPTVTPTNTPTPVPTLGPGARAVIQAETLNVRAAPGTQAERVGVLLQAQSVTVRDGPVDADGYRWWQVENSEGLVGWVAEGTEDSAWLVPVP